MMSATPMPLKHPHVRGEDLFSLASLRSSAETPPRAWGRRGRSEAECKHLRNTPTCVGKTSLTSAHRGTMGKHPHVRGEDFNKLSGTVSDVETPPRAWGRRSHNGAPDMTPGNTPTCVGKTLRDYSLFLLSRQNNIETSSFSDTSCSPDNSMSWRFGSPMP